MLISALIGEADAAPVVLIDWLAGGRPGPLITSTRNVTEVERTLRRKLPAALPAWDTFLQRAGIGVVAATKARTPGVNAKDAAIVAAAVRAAATHFVTGDKRLLAEMERNAIRVPLPVTPRQMLDELMKQ